MDKISGSSPNHPIYPDPAAQANAPQAKKAAAANALTQVATTTSVPGQASGSVVGASLPAPTALSGGFSLQGLLQSLQFEMEQLGFKSMAQNVNTNLGKIEQKLNTYESFHQRRIAVAERIRQADSVIEKYAKSVDGEIDSQSGILGAKSSNLKHADDEFAAATKQEANLRKELSQIPAGDQYKPQRDAVNERLLSAQADLREAKSKQSAAQFGFGQQSDFVDALKSRKKELQTLGTGNRALQSQLRLVAMAGIQGNISQDDLNRLLAATDRNTHPVDAMRALSGPAADSLAKAAAGKGDALSAMQTANLLDIGELTHPFETAYKDLEFEFASNEDVRQKINEALFQPKDEAAEKTIDDIEEQISIVLQLMMARWADDEIIEENLDQEFRKKLSV